MIKERETKVVDKVRDSEEIIPFQYSITAYGADYPVDSLVKRINDGTIFIPPFQRQFRWDRKRASRFVESFLLGLPVPGIFLSREEGTNKLIVIDGHQRLRTLQCFYKGVFTDSKKFSLIDVQQQYNGATYESISEEDRRRLDDSILHATIIRQDEPSDDNSSVYQIFNRLNTGGVNLNPQELRACLYHGEFNDLLRSLNENSCWRKLFGPVSSRLRDQELILRFLALYFGGKYSKPMAGFLNKYMGANRHLKLQSSDEISQVFNNTVETLNKYLGRKPYIALHSYIIQDMLDIGFLMRGEIIWNKASSASPSTAWGTWLSAANPVLRDIHEYILIFSKEAFNRKKLPGKISTISREEFLEFTKSVWTFPAESARKIGHPAPFPIELPNRLIQLYTFKDEVVLDPFCGSGSTCIAALKADRHYIGYDTEEEYVRLAEKRIRQYKRGSVIPMFAEKKGELAITKDNQATYISGDNLS